MRAIALSIAAVGLLALAGSSAPVAALLAASDRASSLSIKLTYPPDGAKIPINGTALNVIKLTYNVTGSCKLGAPLVDPYARQKGASEWTPGPLGGGIGASDEHTANFYYGPTYLSPAHYPAIQWIVHAVCGEDVHTGADRNPGSGKGVDSDIRTFYLVQQAKKESPCKAKITFAVGNVRINGAPAGVGDEIGVGDTISTAGRTRVELKLGDKSLIRLGPETKLEVDLATCVTFGKSVEDRKVSLKLEVGNIWAKIAHAVGGDYKFEVHNSAATAGVRDTVIEASYEPGNKLTRMRVDEGRGYLRNRSGAQKTVNLSAGFCSKVRKGGPPSAPSRCSPFFVWGGTRI